MCKSTNCRCFVSLLVFLAIFLVYQPSFAAPITGPYVPGEVIIKYRDSATAGDINTLSAQLNSVRLRDFSRIGASLERLTDKTVPEAIAQLENNPMVEYIEPNYLYTIDGIPDDPDFNLLWGMHNTGQTGGTPDADIDAPEAWNQFTGSNSVIVGVIDTGVDYNHPDLAANIWTNPGEIAGNGIDDDNNGYIDDIHGWDFVNNDNDPMDDHSHGTHCSGTIGGVGNNGVGVAGTAWNIRIMACRFLDSQGYGTTADAIDCVAYATMMGANLTSNSWGGGSFSAALEAAIQDAYDAGVLFVAAAGNSGDDNDSYPHYPSSYTTGNIVAVGATDADDNRVSTSTWASCYGLTSVDIGAPGLDIYSTLPNNSYGSKSGTSMATPHVSGVLALVIGQYPGITVDAAKTLIFNSADVLPQLSGLWVTGARINAAKALSGPDSIPPYPVADLAVEEEASNWMSLTWTATGDDGDSGQAASYDIRYATAPIDSTNFDAATRVTAPPFPSAPGQPDSVRVTGLDFSTTYYFALKIRDEYGNSSGISNVASGTTLGIPVVSFSPANMSVSLITGEQQDQILTLSNTGEGTLDFQLDTVKADSTATAMRAAAAAVVEGITPSGTAWLDGEPVTVLSPEEKALLLSRLNTYEQAGVSSAAGALPVVGVGGAYAPDMMYILLADSQLAGLFTFVQVDYVNDDLTQVEGLVVSEADYGLDETRATALRDFFDSGRPIFIGMDDWDEIWYGAVPGLLGPVFGITNPIDNDFCSDPVLNPNHPINTGLAGFNLGGSWCNDNDSFQLDGAEWLVNGNPSPATFGVAFDGSSRSVCMGETLAGIWDVNAQLNANALIWMMEGGGIPTVAPVTGSIPAGGSLDITVTFDAADLCGGDFYSEVVINTNDPVDPEVRMPAVMTVTGEPDIDVSDTVLDYGEVFIGAVVTDTLIVSNPGCDVIEVTAVAIDHPDFTADLTPFSLQVGDWKNLVVEYTPGGAGPVTGTLSLTSNDPDQPVVEVALAADGLVAPIITVNPDSLAADLLTGETSTDLLTVSNTGGNDLVFKVGTENLTPSAGSVSIATGKVISAAPAGASEAPGAVWDAGASPLRGPLSAPINTIPGAQATDLALLLLGNGSMTEIQTQLMAYSDIAVVDIFLTTGGNPTLAELSAYHAVILANSSSFSNAAGLGDVLADYVDQGGGVVQTIASFVDGFQLQGRFMDEGYAAFDLGTGPVGYGILGSYDSSHPIMAGVTSLAGDLLATAPLAPGAQWVADWDFGEPFVATQGTNVAGVNVFVASSGYWTGDLPLVLHNAALWVSGAARWLFVDPTLGTVPAGTDLDLLITFDATGVCGGTYAADIHLDSNDPLTPRLTVPVEMQVTGEPDIAVSDTVLAYGAHFIGAVVPDTLWVNNPGCDLLQVTSLTIDHADFSVDTTPFDLAVGEVRALEVLFNPTSASQMNGTLSLACNDPDTPLITVALSGEGLVAPEITVDPASIQAELLTGEIQTHQVTLANVGGSELVWSARTAKRDSLAALVAAAAAAAVDGLSPSGTVWGDDGAMTVLSEEEKYLFSSRVEAYRQTVLSLGAADVLPEVGVGGGGAYDMFYLLLNNPQLSSLYTFLLLDYEQDDLSGLAGLVLSESDHALTASKAEVIRDFFDSGRGVFIGMDDFDSIWYPPVSDLLGPVFGMSAAMDGNLCGNAMLNADHPINQGITQFNLGGNWCNDNDHFVLDGADWLFMESALGYYYGIANDSGARSVTMGEMLAGIWTTNEQLNANALIWIMEGSGLPTVIPESGVIPAGGSQVLEVTFDASDLCGGNYYSDLVISNNDPLMPELLVPADMHVTGETDIAVSDTLLAYGQVFMGAVITDTLVVSNPGCDLLTVTDLTIDQGDFSTDTTPFNLDVGQEHFLVVSYSPGSLGAVSGTLTLTSNDPDQPVVTVALTAEAIEAPVLGVNPLQLTSTLVTGETDTQILTLSNTGGNDLVWDISATPRDSLASLLRAAAAEVVAGIVPSDQVETEGYSHPALSESERLLMEERMAAYRQTVESLGAADVFPQVGVCGSYSYDLNYYLMNNPQLTGMFTFLVMDYSAAILPDMDGLAIAEYYYNFSEADAAILSAFQADGGGIMFGLGGLSNIWSGNMAALLGPVFGISGTNNEAFCANPQLNTNHPINNGISTFNLGGDWCYSNDSFIASTAQWLFGNSVTGAKFGMANQGRGRSVIVGENLAWVWTPNIQLNANALIWVMEGAGVPGLDPISGVIPPGGTQQVDVTFDATSLCGGTYLSDLVLRCNDPVAAEFLVPADLTVVGEPDIAVSDTLLAYGSQFIGGVIPDTLVIQNPGCDLLTISSLAIDHVDFSTDTTPFDLQVGEEKILEVFYSPTSVGPAAGTLSLVTNDPDTPLVDVLLTGSGLLAPVVGVSPSQLTASLVTGETDTQVLTITNTGGSPLDWEIFTAKRDSTAALLLAAAATVVEGITPGGSIEIDGVTYPALSDEQRALMDDRMVVYEQTVSGLDAADLALLGVGGGSGYDLTYYFMNQPELASRYAFRLVDYVNDDLTDLDGLAVAEYYSISESRAIALSNFYLSGRGLIMGTDDLANAWTGSIPALLGPVFGVSGVFNGNLCSNPELNPVHPINAGLSTFNLGGDWCYSNNHYMPTTAEWLFRDGATGYMYGVANRGAERTVLMGENLAYIWTANLDLNVAAVIWMMEGSGLPLVEPAAGTVPVGGVQTVDVTFDATDLCGGTFLSNLIIANNDPLTPTVTVQADMIVTGEPDIALSDTLVAFGQVYIGATVVDTVWVANEGCDVLSVRPFTAERIEDFGFLIDLTPFDLDIGETRAMEVLFAPTAEGVVSGELALATNDPDASSVSIQLSGEGVTPPLMAVDPAAFDVTLLPDEIQTHQLTLANNGGADLVWTISPTRRDSTAVLMQQAAAAVVAGIVPSGVLEVDGVAHPVLTEGERALLEERLVTYGQTLADLAVDLPVVGCSGTYGADLAYYMLSSNELTSMYQIRILDYRYTDLSQIDGLAISSHFTQFGQSEAAILRDYYDNGGVIFMGIESLPYSWNNGTVPTLLEPVFGISGPVAGNFCSNAGVNPAHPITMGISGFSLGGNWCYSNHYFEPTTADWLFGDMATGHSFGMANDNTGRAVIMGEPLSWIWQANEQLNVNAVLWMMSGIGLPTVDPAEGVVAAGGSQVVDVTFDATDICGGDYFADLRILSNDPVTPELVVPADWHVLGVPELSLPDTMLAFGNVFLGYSADDTVTIMNTGCGPLEVTAVSIDHADFTSVADPFTLPVDGTFLLPVTYTPTSTGPASATLTLTCNDPTRPEVQIVLTGQGMDVPVVGVSPAQLSAELEQGQSETMMLTLGNSGDGELAYSIRTVNPVSEASGTVTGPTGRILNPGATGGMKMMLAPFADPTVTSGSAGSADGFEPMGDPNPVPTESIDTGSNLALKLLLLGSGELLGMQADLLAYSDIQVVDIFYADTATPTLDDLLGYHVVILANNFAFQDPMGTGDVLADYVDQGGGVIQTEGSFISGFNLTGRFMDEGYAVFEVDTGPSGSAVLANFDHAHPIMAGVTSASCEITSNTTLVPGASWVADWSNGRVCAATNGDQVVGLNVFFAQAGRWQGDVDLMLHNAAVWIGGRVPWLDVAPMAGTIPGAGSVDLMVTFDAGSRNPGTYDALIEVGSNDPVTPLVTVPVQLTVTSALMTVNIDVTAGAASDIDNVLGMAAGATDGYDGAFDLPEPPPAPADYVAGYFFHPEWNSPLGDRFMTDIRDSYDPATAMKSWPFVVETDLADSVTLDFTPSFLASTGWQLWLRDEATGGMHNLFPSLTYTFEPQGGARAFTIYVGSVIPPLYPPERQLAAGWSLLGAPLVPPAGADTWADVLLDDTGGATYLFDYEGATGYGDVAGSEPVGQGQGVWLASTESFIWTMSGNPEDGTINIPAMVGWNLVGYPLWIGGSLNGVSVEHGGQQYLWPDAVAQGLVSPFVYDYNPVTDTYAAVAALEPWRGYWMAAHVSGVTLQFNYRTMLGIIPPAAAAAAGGDEVGTLPRLVQAGAVVQDKAVDEKSGGLPWQLEIALDQGAGRVAIGQAPDATSGFDTAYDLPIPPSSPGGSNKAALVIRHPEWNLPCGSGFYSDVTALVGEAREWTLTVSVPDPSTVTLGWNPLDLPADVDLQVYLPRENRVAVMSVRETASVQIDVGSAPVEVVFRSTDGMSGVPGAQAGLQLHNVPNPFNPLTEFRFNLPRAGEAEIRVFDIRGAVVRRVVGGVMPAGPASLKWAGKDGAGRRVASGIYFYRLYLDDRQEGPTLKMTLVK